MRTINSFWVYSDKYVLLDSYSTAWALGSLKQIQELEKEYNNDENLSFYGPFEIAQISESTSILYESHKSQITYL